MTFQTIEIALTYGDPATFEGMTPAKIRVVLCDNDAMVRRAIGLYVSNAESLELVATCSTGPETLQVLRTRPVDVLLLDLRMPEMDGFAVAREVAEASASCKVLYLTSFLDSEAHVDVMAGRVQGLLAKDLEPVSLVKAIHVAHDGLIVLSPSALQMEKLPPGSRPPASELTTNEREEEVLRLLFLGMSNAAIAQQMHLSESSVKSVLATLMVRANVNNRTALVMAAMRR